MSATDIAGPDETSQRLALALSAFDLAEWRLDPTTQTMTWDANGAEIFGISSGGGVSLSDWLDRVDAGDRDTVSDVMIPGRAGSDGIQFRFRRPDGSERTLFAQTRDLTDGAGRVIAVLGLTRDRTTEARQDEAARRLRADLQHRIKNMVAIIRSMTERTRRNSPDLDSFVAHFEGRLGAFARTHGVLARTAAGEASLEEIIHEELRQGTSSGLEPWSVEGPTVMLGQKPAEGMALAIHELTTNAVKFGSLTEPGGDLVVTWSVQENPSPRLVFDWVETGKTDRADRGPDGFGLETLQRALPYQLGAQTDLAFDRRGVRCRIILPLDAAIMP